MKESFSSSSTFRVLYVGILVRVEWCAGMSAHVLHHCPRAGKTLIAVSLLRCARIEEPLLRSYQDEALQQVGLGNNKKALMMFSSLAVVRQFLERHLPDLEGFQVVLVCSLAYKGVKNCTDAAKLTKFLNSSKKTVFLCSYESARVVDESLRLSGKSMDLSIFDEAHNVHTPQRFFLWGGEERLDECGEEDDDALHEGTDSDSEPDAGCGASDDASVEAEDAMESEPEGDSGGSDDEGAAAADALAPTPEGLLHLSTHYPKRVYMTGTPSNKMQKYPEVYGYAWHRVSYNDLWSTQDPTCPIVKGFDVRVVVNGLPEEGKESREFYDCVSVLRAIGEALADGTDVKRVKMYHARAVQDNRSAENFGNKELWRRALTYLQKRRECISIRYSKLVVSDVNGSMGKEVDKRLKEFNQKADDKIRILCSCQIFREGVTLERCDLTVFADGKRSQRDIIQSGMRGLKADRAPSAGDDARLRILLLASLDAVQITSENESARITEALQKRSKMEHIAVILSALKEEDSTLEEYMAALANQETQHSRPQNYKENGIAQNNRCAKRFHMVVAPELLWRLSNGEKERIVAQVAATAVIHLQIKKASVKTKVNWLCAMWRKEKPQRDDKRTVPEDLLEEEEPQEFDGGGFLSRIYINWTEKRATTQLDAEDKANIEAMPWFREWRGGKAALVKRKVRWLCAMWKNDKPKQGDKQLVPQDLLEEEEQQEFDGEGFLRHTYHNWTEKRTHTLLDAEDKAKIEAMPWFKEWQGGKAALVKRKVRWLCAMWRNDKPKQRNKKSVPREVLEGEEPQEFDGGAFLDSIYNNWTEKRPNAKLDAEDKAKIEAMPWFKEWRGGLAAATKRKVRWLCAMWKNEKPKRGKRGKQGSLSVPEDLLEGEEQQEFNGGNFLGSIYDNWTGRHANAKLDAEDKAKIEAMPWFKEWRTGVAASTKRKVRWLCAMWKNEKPQRGKKGRLSVPQDLLEGQESQEFDGGQFLINVYNNWTEKRQRTQLDAEDKAKMEALPWFSKWQDPRGAAVKRKVRWLCEMWKHKKPQRGKEDNRSVPRHLREGKKPQEFRGGLFLNSIFNNWTEKCPKTHLDAEDKAKIEEMPWFEEWNPSRKRRPCKESSQMERAGANISTDLAPQQARPKRRKKESAGSHGCDVINFEEMNHAPAGTIEKVIQGSPKQTQESSLRAIAQNEASPASTSLSPRNLQDDPPSQSVQEKNKEDYVTSSKRIRSEDNTQIGEPQKKLARIQKKRPADIKKDVEALCKKLGINVEGSVADPEVARASQGYDASVFDEAHQAFKDFTSAEFRDLAPQSPEFVEAGRILYLDHWTDDSKKDKLRTTPILVKKIEKEQLYCVNPDTSIVRCLRDVYGVHAAQGFLEEVLQPGGAFAHLKFSAVYADLCTGTADNVITNLEAICRHVLPRSLVCYTMTGRDRHGESMVRRFVRIHAAMEHKGFRYARDRAEDSLHEFRSPAATVTTVFYSRQ